MKINVEKDEIIFKPESNIDYCSIGIMYGRLTSILCCIADNACVENMKSEIKCLKIKNNELIRYLTGFK